MKETTSIKKFMRAIEQLPPDAPVEDPEVWYKTQKEHWREWLQGYQSSGGYGRKGNKERDASYAYNHIVEYRMSLWIIDAAGVNPKLVRAARHASAHACTKQGKSGAIRRIVPWETLAAALWGNKE